MRQNDQIDTQMDDADYSSWLEVVKQLKKLKLKNDSTDLSKVRFALITQLRDALDKSLSFPAACSLIGVSLFIWGVVDLNHHGRNLGGFYEPKELRPIFKQEFFQSLAKYYSKGMPRQKKIAFTQDDLKRENAFDNRVKANSKSTLPAKILKAAGGVQNITLCTERFYDEQWVQTQKKQHLQRVLTQLYGDKKAERIRSLDLKQLKEFFQENLCENSSYFIKLNEWVDCLIAEDTSKEFPTPPPLPVANVSKGSVDFNESKIPEAAPSSDLEESQDDGDDPQTSEAEVSIDNERSRRSVSVASRTSKASKSSKASTSSTSSTTSKARWRMRKENGNVYEVYNTEEANAEAKGDLKRPQYIDDFNENHLIAAIRSKHLEVDIQAVQPYGKGYRVAMDVCRGEVRIPILFASKELPHLYPLDQQRGINSELEKLKAKRKPLTVRKAERNTTLDSYE